jgi:hypothetical protein
MLDPLTNYNINKFFLILIPKFLMNKLPSVLTAFIVSIAPYTPINAIVFMLVFIIIYLINPFNLANRKEHYCRFNKPNTRYKNDIWTALKNTYYYYIIIALMINYNTITQYNMFNIVIK